MKILIVEDEDKKFDEYIKVIKNIPGEQFSVDRVSTLPELYAKKEKFNSFDLVILDFFLPVVSGGAETNVFADVVKLVNTTALSRIPVISISAYFEDLKPKLGDLQKCGISVYDFEEDIWASALVSKLENVQQKHRYDFIGFCALEIEREGFFNCDQIEIYKTNVERLGNSCIEVKFGDKFGVLVTMPYMGMIDAASVVSKFLTEYSPKVTFMSGICGGTGDSVLGQLLVTDFSYDYQCGKWSKDGFKLGAYPAGPSERIKSKLRLLMKTDKCTKDALETELHSIHRPSPPSHPILAIFGSGSAVIASSKKLKDINETHRKLLGIDMEIYGFHRAVALSHSNVIDFSAKVVVDKTDERKGDELHKYGSIISARFCILALCEFLK
ncbi:MAG: hypothetical protein COB08_005195 [Rhodobacteraceae bacterium]|nr:hypothetical protein [Paracoccaceae bacterium]